LVVLGLIVLPRRRKAQSIEPLREAPSLLGRSTSLKSIGQPKILGIVGGVTIATLLSAWWAFIPLSLAALVMIRLPRGRMIVAALTGLALIIATGSATLQAHSWPWNILWPQHFGVANAAVWCALALAFLDATIEHSALLQPRPEPEATIAVEVDDKDGDGPEHAPMGESEEVTFRLVEDREATAAPLGQDASEDLGEELFPLDEAGQAEFLSPHSDDHLPVGSSAFEVTALSSSLGGAGAILASVVAGEAEIPPLPDSLTTKADKPRPSPEAESEEVPLALPTGIRRSIALFRVFRVEQTDPDRFYRTLAEDTANQLASYAPLFNRTIVDVGGGPGYFSEAFESRGAKVILVEPDARPLEIRDPSLPFANFEERHDYAVIPGRLHEGRTISGDGMRLPFADNSVDISFSSNVLEHVPDPSAFFDEALRITKPNGTVYCSFTVWSSPWGGHETSPWHHFGGEYAARRYEKKHGRPPGNRFGSSLFKVRVKDALKLVKDRQDVSLVWAFPRYYPEWASWIIRVPILREFGTWNLLLILRKDVSVSDDGAARPPVQGLGRPPQQFGPSESASRFQEPRD
jgi:SAM-dependent methyltransferase